MGVTVCLQARQDMGCNSLVISIFFLPVILSAIIHDDLTMDTARHKLDPEVIPHQFRENALEQFKVSLDNKKKQLHKKKTDMRKGYVVHKTKIFKKPSEPEVEEKTSDDDNLVEISSSGNNSSAPFSWIRNKLSLLDLSRTVNSMVDSSSKSMKNIVDSFSSTLWHMTMPAHIVV